MTTKYQSPSTPETQHDLQNFIVEAILINRYGAIPPGGWRKGGPFFKDWGQLLTKVRRVAKLGLDAKQLAWYVQNYKVTDLDYKEFGLLKWKVKTHFRWCDVDQFVTYYTALYKSVAGKGSSYTEQTVGYKMKEGSSNRRKTLTDILQELEHGN